MKPVVYSFFIKLILEFWFAFVRVKEIAIPEDTERLIESRGGFILAGFHNQILSLTHHCSKYLAGKRRIKLTPLVSQSKDGELTYQLFLRFNLHSERGSSSKGGAAGLRGLLRRIRDGWVPIFTPDGPRGPAYKVQPGVVQLASATGVPIVHFFSSYDRAFQARSWDKHKFPRFGARQYIEYSKPMMIPARLEREGLEKYCQDLENSMMAQVDRVEKKAAGEGG